MVNALPVRSGLIRRTVTGVAVAVLGISALTGCAAGQHAQTVGQIPAVDGVGADSGTLSVRAAAIVAPQGADNYAKGSSAPITVVLINNGNAADQLTSVASPDAGSATISLTSASAVSSASPAVTAPTATPAPSASSTPIDLPPGQSVQVGYAAGGPSIVLNGLTTDLFPSQTIPVTFTFASGATVATTLAVQISPDGSSGAPTVDISPSEG